MAHHHGALLSLMSLLPLIVRAYIPALPSNDTSSLVESDDGIHIAWLPNGIVTASVSRQLVADPIDPNSTVTIVPWTKYSKVRLLNLSATSDRVADLAVQGVLVHFTEAETDQAPSEVPWIATVCCDSNGTSFSMQDDIFTLARDRGAQAALLYSLYSEVGPLPFAKLACRTDQCRTIGMHHE